MRVCVEAVQHYVMWKWANYRNLPKKIELSLFEIPLRIFRVRTIGSNVDRIEHQIACPTMANSSLQRVAWAVQSFVTVAFEIRLEGLNFYYVMGVKVNNTLLFSL